MVDTAGTEVRSPFSGQSRRWMVLFAATAAGVVAMAATAIRDPRAPAGGEAVAADGRADAVPLVSYVVAGHGKPSGEITLPASLHPLQEATVHARTSGYIRRWHAEMGDTVRKGDLLAEIETPELDRELEQARANLAQMRAHLDLARATARRYRALLENEAVSPQEVDEKAGALAVKEADVAAIQAKVRQLESVKAFQRILAPFSGTVTARNVEVGTLATAGSSSSTPWLYRIAQSDVMRVFVSVPQSQMSAVRTGTVAELTIPELGDTPIAARVTRNAGAFDPATRTLLTELRVDNPGHRILPGMYGQVRLKVTYESPPIVVPVNAVLVGGEGLRVAVIDAQDIVHIRPVKLGRDLGKQVEILSGLEAGQRVVNNPRDNLAEGTRVRAALAERPEDKRKDASRSAAGK